MRILAIYRHYWPDATPYARMLRGILEHLADLGHSAVVLTAQPNYNDIAQPTQPRRETLGKVDIRRLRLLPERKRFRLLRAVNFLYFLLRAIGHTCRHRQYDLIVANSHPPVLMGIALRVIRRLTGIPYVLHCQDVHPESALLAHQLQDNWAYRLMKRADTKSCSEACCVVTLSDDMWATLRARSDYSADNVRVINNFPLDVYQENEQALPVFEDSEDVNPQPYRVLFAGNLGRFQNLPRIVEAAHLLQGEPHIQFVFMGAGVERDRLQKKTGHLLGKTVFFEPFQPVETALAYMKRADLGIVSLAADVYRVAYPSKTMTYLAAGCPVLAIAEPASQLAKDIIQSDFGYVPADCSPEEIAAAIRRASNDDGRWTHQARLALAKRSEIFFGRGRSMQAWEELIGSLEKLNPVLNNVAALPTLTVSKSAA